METVKDRAKDSSVSGKSIFAAVTTPIASTVVLMLLERGLRRCCRDESFVDL
jgi:hypothetical protein